MRLCVSENRLTSLPPLARMAKLSLLDVSHNSLASLPDIGGLQSLQTLHAQHNQLQSLPDLAPLRSLAVMDLRENRLASIGSLPASPHLAKVLLSFNQLTALPCFQDERVLSTALAEVHLSNNHLTLKSLEGGLLGAVATLHTLDVSQCDVADVPAELGYLPKLQRLILNGNPIKRIRRALLEGPVSDLKAYLRTRGPPHPALKGAVEERDGLGGAEEKGGDVDLGVLSRDAAASGALKLEPGVNPSHALTPNVTDNLVSLDVTGCGECTRA